MPRVNAIIRRRAFDGRNVITPGRLRIDLLCNSIRVVDTELGLTRYGRGGR